MSRGEPEYASQRHMGRSFLSSLMRTSKGEESASSLTMVGLEQGDDAPSNEVRADHTGTDDDSGAALHPDPGSGPGHAILCRLRREDVSEQGELKQDLLHRAEADDQQHRRHGSGVELGHVV